MDRKGRFPIGDHRAFLSSRKGSCSIPSFDRAIRSAQKVDFFNGMRGSDCSIEKHFEAHRISHHPTEHTITPHKSSDAGLTVTILLRMLLLLLTTTRRGTSCSRPPAVRVIDDLFASPLLQHLLLCSIWRLSTKSNATTATMKRMSAPRAPNERFARGKGATKTCSLQAL